MKIIVANYIQNNRSALIGMTLALLAAIFFSVKAIFVKLAYQYGVDAITLLTLRMAFALPVFAFVAAHELRKSGRPSIDRRQVIAMIALGLLGAYLAGLLDFLGLQYVQASIERLTLFLYPTLTVLLSFLLFKRSIRRPEIAALILSYLGIALSVQQEVSLDGDNSILGVALVFGSTLAYALYLIGSGELIPRIGTRLFMAISTIVSCVAVIVQFLFTRDLSTMIQPFPVYAYGLLIAILSTVLPAFMLGAAIHRIGASHTSIIGGIGPVATIVLAVIFLGETMTGIQAFGATLVVGGVLLIGLKRKRT